MYSTSFGFRQPYQVLGACNFLSSAHFPSDTFNR
jgi:hypothetical protein